MCGTYSDIREQLISAAIVADLRVHGFEPEGDGFVRNYDWTCPPDRIPGPGGAEPAPQHVTRPNSDAMFLPGDIYRKWRERFTTMFEPFLTLPDPADFSAAAAVIESAKAKVSSGHPDAKKVMVAASDEMNAFLGEGRRWLGDMNGNTVEAFVRNYMDRFENVAWGQFAVLHELERALCEEEQIWDRTRRDFGFIAQDSLECMLVVQDRSSVDWDLILTVASKVTAIVSLIPPASFLASVVQVASDYGQTIAGARSVPVTAASADEVYTGMLAAVDELKGQIARSESHIQHRLSHVHDLVHANESHVFCLPRPGGLLGETDAGDFYDPRWDRYRNGELKIDPSRCRRVGRKTMPELARTFNVAADQADGTTGRLAWTRDPSLGTGATGAYDAFDALRQTICGYLDRTATALVDSGEHLAIAAEHIEETDRQVAAALNRHIQRMHDRRDRPTPSADTPAPPDHHAGWRPWQEMMVA